MNQLKHNKKDIETAGCAYCENALHMDGGEYYIPNPNLEKCRSCRNYDLSDLANQKKSRLLSESEIVDLMG